MISVILIGAGNVACHFFEAFKRSEGVTVVQWYNRSISKIVSHKNEVGITDNLANLKEADIYIMAVSDDAISPLSSSLPFEDRLVVHTSGSASVHELDKKLDRGVFYPLQTFSKDAEINFTNVPMCIEVLEKENLKKLKALALSLGSDYYKINTEQRQTLHVSAVFVNNFVNQLYRIAHEISDAKSINFDILKPLILETALKVQNMSPYTAQTGPALRNDKKTIKRHLKLLEKKEHKEIYEMFTKSIKQTHGIR